MSKMRPAPPPSWSRRALAFKLALGLALAAGFGYAFLRGSDLHRLAEAVRAAAPAPFVLAIVLAMAGFWLRALRWQCLLRPVRVVSVRSSFDVLMIGYLCSLVLPGRVGDFVVRPALMARDEDVPVASSLATIAVERLLDLLAVVAFFSLYLVASSGRVELELGRARALGWALLAASALGVGLLAMLRGRGERWLARMARLLGPLSPRLRERVLGQVRRFGEGLNLFEDGRNALAAAAYSLGAWLTVGASMWLTCRSLDLDEVGLADSCLLMGLGALGVAVPTPGGTGSFHVAIFYGLRALGVSDEPRAQAAAFLMWALSLVPVGLLGVAAVLRRGVRIAEIRATVAARPPAADAGPPEVAADRPVLAGTSPGVARTRPGVVETPPG